jgi:hypothetical protein
MVRWQPKYPKSNNSVPETDTITALGRLLSNGTLRDAYATAPEQTIKGLGLPESERDAFLHLTSEDLEAQAGVLLHKRYKKIAQLLPQTCARLGTEAWVLFARCSRSFWPTNKRAELQDAGIFIQYLKENNPGSIVRSEQNRISFCLEEKLMAFHSTPDLWVRNRLRRGVQIIFRSGRSSFQEYIFYLGF